MNPKVTIAIPVYNGEEFIEYAIKSALAQTYANIEIIIVDNASTDDTVKISEKYVPKIKLFQNKKNIGLNGNWQRCIELATGEYLVLFAHDDVMYPKFVETAIGVFAKHKDVAIFGCVAQGIDKNGVKTSGVPMVFGYGKIESEEYKNELFKLEKIIAPQQTVLNLKIAKEVGGFHKKYNFCPEVDLYMKMMIRGFSVCFTEQILVSRRIMSEQHSKTSGYVKRLTDYINFFSDYRDVIDSALVRQRQKKYYLRCISLILGSKQSVREKFKYAKLIIQLNMNFFDMIYILLSEILKKRKK